MNHVLVKQLSIMMILDTNLFITQILQVLRNPRRDMRKIILKNISRTKQLFISPHELIIRAHKLLFRAHKLLTRAHELITRAHEIIT